MICLQIVFGLAVLGAGVAMLASPDAFLTLSGLRFTRGITVESIEDQSDEDQRELNIQRGCTGTLIVITGLGYLCVVTVL